VKRLIQFLPDYNLTPYFALGAQFVNNQARTDESHPNIHPDAQVIITREKAKQNKFQNHKSHAADRWKRAGTLIMHLSRATRHYRDQISITHKEDMSSVDCFDGARLRAGGSPVQDGAKSNEQDEDMITIHPIVDGRLKNVAVE
jgi:5'-nucleotidase